MIIYKLTSPSNKCYIGQTKNSINIRWKQHRQAWNSLNKIPYKNTTVKLFYAFDKYPNENEWNIEILCECFDVNEMDEKEMYYIELYDSINNGYNITKGGKGRKVDFLTEEHKTNISNARKNYYDSDSGKEWKNTLSEICSGENNPAFGKKFSHTEETKKDISDKMKGKNVGKDPWNKGKTGVYSEKTLQQMSIGRKGKGLGKDNSKNMLGKPQTEHQKQTVSNIKSKYWIITNPEGNEFEVFGLSNFCKQYNLNRRNITSKSGSKKYKARKK